MAGWPAALPLSRATIEMFGPAIIKPLILFPEFADGFTGNALGRGTSYGNIRYTPVGSTGPYRPEALKIYRFLSDIRLGYCCRKSTRMVRYGHQLIDGGATYLLDSTGGNDGIGQYFASHHRPIAR
ncbi:MAG: hypothetical protein IPP77_09300 [Bacteroidetes bacterium]|nr:hypothetical protein [Bacteroidota bacterium]